MARISEIHYSNAYARESRVKEFVEVALQGSEDPANYVLSFYNQDGTVGLQVRLNDSRVEVFTDTDNNEKIYIVSDVNFRMVITDPDSRSSTNYEATALTDTSGPVPQVVNFYDVGGGTTEITAVDGAAQGATSVNLATPLGPNETRTSIQFNQPDPTTAVYEPLTRGDTGPPCFTQGTRIHTTRGLVAVEDLAPGDMIQTADGAPARLLKVLSRDFGIAAQQADARLRPVRISAGALGQGVPTRDLVVSRQHRMVVNSKIAERMFDQPEVLVPAKSLTRLPGIALEPGTKPVTYFHLLFDTHQVIFAEGAQTESLYAGPEALRALSPKARAEILMIFPELQNADNLPTPARLIPPGARQRQLVERHLKNAQHPLQRAL